MLHHGYLSWQLAEGVALDAGVSRVPFGLLPFASNNWFFNLPYYLGLEDDHDLGLRARLELGEFDVQLAFYKNDEGSFLGTSLDSARYSYDVVATTPEELGFSDGPLALQEHNQVNARVAYPIPFAGEGVAELGVSGQLGGLLDRDSGAFGSHWAGAAHLNASYRRVTVQLEGLYYAHHPPAPYQRSAFVVMGAYDAPYKVARRGFIGLANVAYAIPTELGPLEQVTLYENFSWLAKGEAGAADSFSNIVGASLTTGPVLTYVDFAFGQNHPFIGGDYAVALAEGAGEQWHLRFNVNIGWYF